MSGKKNKKVKGKTVDLGDFLNEGGNQLQPGFTVVQKSNWDDDASGSSLGRIILPTAPIASRGGNVDESKVPKEPPFVAFLGNLPFEITEDEVAHFFGDLKLTSVRLARDSSERFRGFGYAEFEDRKGLIEALGSDGEQLRGREVRVSLPDNNENDGRGGGYGRDRGMRGGAGGGFGSRSERPIERDLPNDWRAAAREEQSSRGFDNYSRSDRYGGREGREGGFGDRDRGGNDSRDWRNDNRGFSARYEPARDREETSSAPAERPKLKIAPRTKPAEPIKVIEEPEPEKKLEKPKVSKPKAADIFGAAKPVDTAAKLQEIEKRLEAKQKEEADKAKSQEKNEQQQKGPSKETSPRHEQPEEESSKMWRDEIRDEKEKKERKQRSERRAPAQVLDEPEFNPTSKNKYADLEVSENQDESGAEDGIQAEN